MRILEFIFIAGCTCAADSIIIYFLKALLTRCFKGYARPLFTLIIVFLLESISVLINSICHMAVRYDILISFLPYTITFTLFMVLIMTLFKMLGTKKTT